jgi:hypothetical protein
LPPSLLGILRCSSSSSHVAASVRGSSCGNPHRLVPPFYAHVRVRVLCVRAGKDSLKTHPAER